MPLVFLPATLRPLAGGATTVEASGGTVREVLQDLLRRQPGLEGRVLDGDGIRPEVFVAVNGEEAFGLDATVPSDAEIHILPAMAGGRDGPAAILTSCVQAATRALSSRSPGDAGFGGPAVQIPAPDA